MNIRQHRQNVVADLWLLRLLVATPASGFEVSRWFKGVEKLRLGSACEIYVALHRLEGVGLLDGEWRRLPGFAHDVRQYRTTSRGLRLIGIDQGDHRPALAVHPLTILVILAVCGRPTTGDGAQDHQLSPLTIVVSPMLPISPQELREASLEVTRILGASGISAEWVFEPRMTTATRSPSPVRPPDYAIHAIVVAGSSSPPADEIVLGVTQRVSPSGADIVLFCEPILEFAAGTREHVPRILALVIAHEIGHVLLPAPVHADTGIMQVPWDRPALEQANNQGLRFTARQGALMRDQLRRWSVARN